jgi:predicted nucleic acid-binding protein
MIVVADSGPLHYLVLLEHIELLRRFYGRVLVPEPVASELSAAGAPAVVRAWMTKPPTWVDVQAVTADAVSMITDTLDLGERAARRIFAPARLQSVSTTRVDIQILSPEVARHQELGLIAP